MLTAFHLHQVDTFGWWVLDAVQQLSGIPARILFFSFRENLKLPRIDLLPVSATFFSFSCFQPNMLNINVTERKPRFSIFKCFLT